MGDSELNYLKLALENINDEMSKEEMALLINEALKQELISTESVVVDGNGRTKISSNNQPIASFMNEVKKELSFDSEKRGKELAKDYLKNLLKFAEEHETDVSVIEYLNVFFNMFD